MKKLFQFQIFIMLVFCFCTASFGQNYQPFRKGLTYHFSSPDSNYYSLQIDSAKVVGGDSVFVFNQTTKKLTSPVPDCNSYPFFGIQIQKNNQFGNKIVKKSNGDYIFQTSQGQPFLLKTKVAINQSWTFNSQKNLTATLTSKSVEPILGTSDSVLTFTLSNGYTIKLSKNYGFLSAVNFVAFVDPAFRRKILQFHALPEKGLGTAIHDPFKIFDFQVGEKFMYLTRTIFSGNTICSNEWKQYEVLSRTTYPNGEIDYTFKVEKLTGWGCQSTGGFTLQPPITEYLNVTDTSHDFTQVLSNGYLIPVSSSDSSLVSLSIFQKPAYNARIQSQFLDLAYIPCANGFRSRIDDGHEIRYGVGLGKTYEQFLSFTTSTETLIAYIKGTETYGTWQSLAQIMGTKEDKEPTLFSTFPNPFTNELTLKFNDTFKAQNATVSVTNLLGQEIYKQVLNSEPKQELKLELPEMAKGVYVLHLTENNRNYTSKIIRE